MLFKKDGKEKNAAEEQLQGEESVLPQPEDFYILPLFFYELQQNGLKSSDPSISQFYDCDETKLKEDEFLSVL